MSGLSNPSSYLSTGNPFASTASPFTTQETFQLAAEGKLDGFGSFLGNSSKTPTSMAIDPVTGVLLAGSIGSSIFGGISSQNAASETARRQERSAWEVGKLNFLAQQEGAKAQLADNMAARAAQFGWGADLDFARQVDAEMLNTGIFGERRQALANREKVFNQALANSPNARLKARFDNELALQQTLAQRMGAMQGMFGQIQPINVSSMFS